MDRRDFAKLLNYWNYPKSKKKLRKKKKWLLRLSKTKKKCAEEKKLVPKAMYKRQWVCQIAKLLKLSKIPSFAEEEKMVPKAMYKRQWFCQIAKLFRRKDHFPWLAKLFI